jgi:uncharacterized iron-regulated membrane protein
LRQAAFGLFSEVPCAPRTSIYKSYNALRSFAHVFVKLHLYIGLVFGVLFILMGLTGTAISWRDEIDKWLNPDLLQAVSATRIPVGAATVESVTAKLMADPHFGKPNLLMLPTDEHDVFVAYYPIKGPRPAPDASAR